MAKQTINVAQVGCGFMGRSHANAYLKVGKFYKLPVDPVMHTAVDLIEPAVKAYAANWGFANWSTDPIKIAQSDEIDFIDICTPNNAHGPIAIAALEAGKHVGCEKPLAADLDEARAMRDAAAGSALSVQRPT